MMKYASDPKDVQDLQFKQSSTRQIFDGFKSIPAVCSLVATDVKRGLLYVGYDNRITVLPCNAETTGDWKFEHELPNIVSRIALSCDCEYVSITFHKSTARIYNARSFTSNNLELLHEIQLSSSSDEVFAYDLRWNPAIAGTFCTIASDHTIGSFVVKTDRRTTVGLVAMEKIGGHEILCAAWSPKGKQIVVGCKNGSIVQLKQDLKIARTIVGPSPSPGGVIAILWISNYQFCATYQDPSDRTIKVLIVDAPKGETNGIFTCYDDITYGMPESEPETSYSRYYLDHIAEWGLIVAASSSSTEVAVLGSHDNGNTWEQWQLVDSGRAQLPLIGTIDSYPVGITIDKSSDKQLAFTPETILPYPVPVLHIFGTSGQLISFHIVNLTPNCPSLCTPPTEMVTAVQTPVSRPSLLPSEISFALNTGVTSTPLPKQSEIPHERPKIVPTANLFNEPLKISLAGQQQQQLQHQQQQWQLQQQQLQQQLQQSQPQQVELKIPRPRLDKVEPPPTKDARKSPVKEAPPPEKPPVDDSLCMRAYLEEQLLFEKELRGKLEVQIWECGTEDEQQKLVARSSIIDEFLRDLRETTNSLSSDIAYLKALLLQSFAWLEETKSKNSANSSGNTRDRSDRNKVKELQRLFYYAQSQLVQATKILDMEWIEQESRDRSRIKIPSLEFIYQSLKRLSEIIAREKSLLELQLKKWKALTRGNRSTIGLDRSMAKMSITSITSGGKNNDVGAIELRCKAIESKTRSFSIEKQMKLRDILMETKTRVIKAINPSPVQDRLEATLSSLASLMPTSNVAKSKIERCSTQARKDQTISPNISQENPLSSLNNIIAKFGQPTSVSENAQNKNANKTFSISNTTAITTTTTTTTAATPLFGWNTGAQAEKKQSVSPLARTMPKQNVTTTLNQSGFSSQLPSTPRSNAFSDVQSISFGTSERKPQEQTTNSLSNIFSKDTKISASKDNCSVAATTSSQDTKVTIVPTTSVITSSKSESTYRPPVSIIDLQGSAVSTASQDGKREAPSSNFNFTNSAQTAAKTTGETVTTGSSLQSLSFAGKPIDPPAFSFASKEAAPAAQNSAQASSDLPGLFDFDLASIGSQNYGKYSGSGINFAEATSAVSSSVSTAPTTTTTTSQASRPPEASVASSTSNIFGGSAKTSTASGATFAKAPTSAPSATIFGTTTGGANIFGGSSSGLSNSLFGNIASSPSSNASSIFAGGQKTSTSETTSAPSAAPTIFGTSGTTPVVAKTETSGTSSFGKLPINFSSPGFGGTLGSSATMLNFGTAVSNTTNSLAFEKPSEIKASMFNQTPAPSSTSPVATKSPATSSPGGLFAGSTGASSNNSVFGNISAAPASTIFGGGNSNQATPSVFETKTTPMAPFGTTSPATIFGAGIQKSPSSLFEGSTATPISSPFGGGSVSPSLQTTSVFGQTATFGAKPVFGAQAPVFGAAKPEFSNPFGTSTFGASAIPSGFSSPPTMGGSPPLGTASMQKVFASATGSSTFEALAGQNGGLTFGNLAQETPETQPPPSFGGGSSFSSWR